MSIATPCHTPVEVANDNNTFAHARWKDYATNGIGQGNPKEKYYWFPLDKLRKLITAPNGDSERWQLLFKAGPCFMGSGVHGPPQWYVLDEK
jgi:hypothetical protein